MEMGLDEYIELSKGIGLTIDQARRMYSINQLCSAKISLPRGDEEWILAFFNTAGAYWICNETFNTLEEAMSAANQARFHEVTVTLYHLPDPYLDTLNDNNTNHR